MGGGKQGHPKNGRTRIRDSTEDGLEINLKNFLVSACEKYRGRT